MARTSELLYQYLCNKVGSEKVVKVRREFFKVLDCAKNDSSDVKETISSGSKSEGLDLPGSDIDIMMMDKTNVIRNEYPAIKPTANDYVLAIDTANTPPGFAKIKVHLPKYRGQNHFIYIQGIQNELTQDQNELFLPNTTLKSYFLLLHDNTLKWSLYKTHGPCSTTIDESVDRVFCFRLDEWPEQALSWVSRMRLHDWPPEDLITNIYQDEKSVLLVPIGCKFGAVEDNPLEWRISFSVAEQMLVYNFNHSQMLCYAMLKILLKQVLDKVEKKCLCSYFMKTLLFWLIEESGCNKWTPSNLLKCFQSCITRLSYHIQYDYFPNYFIIQNNMFEGKNWGSSKAKLLSILHDVHIEGIIQFTLKTKTLNDFVTFTSTNQMSMETCMPYHDEDKALYPLLNNLTNERLKKGSLVNIFFYLKKYKSNYIQSLFILLFVRYSIELAGRKKYDMNRRNKQCYRGYKPLLSYFLLGTNYNLNGWLPLAAFFYQHKQYYNTLKIIDFVCSEITHKKNNITINFNNNNMNTPTFQYIVCKRSSFLQRYKLLCTLRLSIPVIEGTVFDKSDIAIRVPGLKDYNVPFDEYYRRFGHYLRFLCFHHLHDLSKRNRALCDFQQVVDNTFKTQTSVHTIKSITYLEQAYINSGIECPQRNFESNKHALQSFYDDNPAFHNLISDIMNLNVRL